MADSNASGTSGSLSGFLNPLVSGTDASNATNACSSSTSAAQEEQQPSSNEQGPEVLVYPKFFVPEARTPVLLKRNSRPPTPTGELSNSRKSSRNGSRPQSAGSGRAPIGDMFTNGGGSPPHDSSNLKLQRVGLDEPATLAKKSPDAMEIDLNTFDPSAELMARLRPVQLSMNKSEDHSQNVSNQTNIAHLTIAQDLSDQRSVHLTNVVNGIDAATFGTAMTGMQEAANAQAQLAAAQASASTSETTKAEAELLHTDKMLRQTAEFHRQQEESCRQWTALEAQIRNEAQAAMAQQANTFSKQVQKQQQELDGYKKEMERQRCLFEAEYNKNPLSPIRSDEAARSRNGQVQGVD